MPDQDLTNRIRTIFLHQRPHVTIAEATVLLGWSRGEMSRAIAAGEVEVNSTAIGKWIWREELMAKALEIWPMEVIEEALGADAERVLPAGVRLTELRVRLPRHQVAMLEHFAERDRTTVSAALAKKLEGVASANADELRGRWAGLRRRWRGRMPRGRRRSAEGSSAGSCLGDKTNWRAKRLLLGRTAPIVEFLGSAAKTATNPLRQATSS